MQTNRIELKWKMHSFVRFTASACGFDVEVYKSGPGWIHTITKGEELVDHGMYHPPTNNNELAVKVQSERALYEIIEAL